jgi:hypothetical protein
MAGVVRVPMVRDYKWYGTNLACEYETDNRLRDTSDQRKPLIQQ